MKLFNNVNKFALCYASAAISSYMFKHRRKKKFRKSAHLIVCTDKRNCSRSVGGSRLFANGGAKKKKKKNAGKEEKREAREKRKKGERAWGRKEKIAASGFPRCSWNNFDVCMDEGGTTVAFNPFLFLLPSLPPSPPPKSPFPRREFGTPHGELRLSSLNACARDWQWVRKLSLNNESVWRLRARRFSRCKSLKVDPLRDVSRKLLSRYLDTGKPTAIAKKEFEWTSGVKHMWRAEITRSRIPYIWRVF